MIIHELDVIGVAVAPVEADPPLIVDADRPLPHSITSELVEPVSGRNTQIFDPRHGIQQKELRDCPLGGVRRDTFRDPAIGKGLCASVSICPDHMQ